MSLETPATGGHLLWACYIFPHPHRKALCTEAITEAKRRWESAGLHKVLDQLKADLEKASVRAEQGLGVFLPQISGTALSFSLKGAPKDAVIARISWMKPRSEGQESTAEVIGFHLPRHFCVGGAEESRKMSRFIEL